MKITPAPSASDRRTRVYTYVEAVKKFPTNFTPEEITPVLRRINPELTGQIRSLFIVLSDDEFRKVNSKRKADQAASELAREGGSRESGGNEGPTTQTERMSSTSTSSGSVAVSGNAPVQQGGRGAHGSRGSQGSRGAQVGNRGGRGPKRGAEDPPTDPAPEKR